MTSHHKRYSTRIIAVEALKAACDAHPSQRMTQVIVNALGEDPFYVENEDAARKLHEYASRGAE